MARTNADRAADAKATVRFYHKHLGQSPQWDGIEDGITDLLVDLRHLADEIGIPWDRFEARLDLHYREEVGK